VREVAHHALSKGETIGVIALEESVRHAARAQLGLAVSRPLHLPGELERVDEDELREAFDDTVGSGRCYMYDHWGSLTAEALLPKIRYLAKGLGVEWVILDHISIVVSGFAAEGGERERIDQLVTELRTGVEALGIGLHLVSHLRKAAGTPYEEGGRVHLNDLRGSGAIGQLSDAIVAAERNQQDDELANQMQLRVLKNRYSGETGPADKLDYVASTGRLEVAGGHPDVSKVREVLQTGDEF
jgi:twinkle protein